MKIGSTENESHIHFVKKNKKHKKQIFQILSGPFVHKKIEVVRASNVYYPHGNTY